MPSLDKLPTEVVNLICENISSSIQCQLISTCRRLKTQVVPILYRDVTLDVREEDQKSVDSQIACFFRTIRDNLSLALCVRDLSVKGHRPASIEVGYIPIFENDEKDTTDQQTHQPDTRKLVYETCDTNSVIAAMLHKLENLETLHLEYQFWSENGFLPVIYQNCLKKLRKINLGMMFHPYYTGREGELWERMQGSDQMDMSRLRSLMSLPLIESITCVAANDEKDEEIEFASMLPAQNLTYLKLLRSKMTPRGLGKILSATPNLRQLEYEFWIDMKINEDPTVYYDGTVLDNALKPVRNVLERLRLNIRHNGDYKFNGCSWRTEVRGILRSLASFTQLTHLHLPHLLLLGRSIEEANAVKFVNMLPRSLKFLSVFADSLPPLRPFLPVDFTNEKLLDRLYEYHRMES
ncbi:uncharacterized protein BHQ10_002339 [Talaromyces amestolkiae]|uniref:F-box domain-containing protein n=1 Tax=Talaromyces amestolkiae TaxID=1196081 RepID=A0A364KS02_TALAM|nr:uncharacterized protein BHQ10_002339 [Talaromyces amestolkiae]RAO66327.1 hypothetical protein BHQ10_002339 [Talaromyces amestolkiae]